MVAERRAKGGRSRGAGSAGGTDCHTVNRFGSLAEESCGRTAEALSAWYCRACGLFASCDACWPVTKRNRRPASATFSTGSSALLSESGFVAPNGRQCSSESPARSVAAGAGSVAALVCPRRATQFAGPGSLGPGSLASRTRPQWAWFHAWWNAGLSWSGGWSGFGPRNGTAGYGRGDDSSSNDTISYLPCVAAGPG